MGREALKVPSLRFANSREIRDGGKSQKCDRSHMGSSWSGFRGDRIRRRGALD